MNERSTNSAEETPFDSKPFEGVDDSFDEFHGAPINDDTQNDDARNGKPPFSDEDNSDENRARNFDNIAAENGFRGLGYGGDRDPQEILHEYRQAARENPDSSRHQADLAEGFAAADQPHKALRQYQKALQMQRDKGQEEMPDAHLGIGDLCRTFALSAAAVRSYERAVRLRPERSYYRWKLAVALAAMGLYDQSVTQMSKAIEIAPRDTYYRFQLADVYLLMGCDDDAISELERVVELAPRDDYYRLRLGAALLKNQRSEEAVAQFERAVTLQPENPSYRTLLRYAYTRNGQEPSISVEVDMIALGAYDEDFVRRIQRLAGETAVAS